MSDKTAIEWTDATWNPVTGCTKVSAGCDHCYAETFAERWRGTQGHYFENGFDVQLRPDKIDQPLRWTKPRRIFVNSMSDLFHDAVPDEYIARVFGVMAASPQHTFQLLTKRHGRMRSLLSSELFREQIFLSNNADQGDILGDRWPIPNVWLGVSVEDQQWAGIRIPALLDTPAAVRFLSCEPLLGPVRIDVPPFWCYGHGRPAGNCPNDLHLDRRGIDWVIVGGESGGGARPMHPDWARSLRDQCQTVGVPFLFKQWGEWQDGSAGPSQRGENHVIVRDGRHEPWAGHTRADGGPATELARARLLHKPGTERAVVISRVGKKAAGRELDGRTWDEYPGAAA